MGRRPKITMREIDVAFGVVAGGGTKTAAARIIGVTRSSFYAYLARHPSARARLEEAQEIALGIVERRLFEQTRENVTAAIFYLCNRGPDRWRHVQHIRHGAEGDFAKALERILGSSHSAPDVVSRTASASGATGNVVPIRPVYSEDASTSP